MPEGQQRVANELDHSSLLKEARELVEEYRTDDSFYISKDLDNDTVTAIADTARNLSDSLWETLPIKIKDPVRLGGRYHLWSSAPERPAIGDILSLSEDDFTSYTLALSLAGLWTACESRGDETRHCSTS